MQLVSTQPRKKYAYDLERERRSKEKQAGKNNRKVKHALEVCKDRIREIKIMLKDHSLPPIDLWRLRGEYSGLDMVHSILSQDERGYREPIEAKEG